MSSIWQQQPFTPCKLCERVGSSCTTHICSACSHQGLSNSQLGWLTCLKLAAMNSGLLLPKLRLPYSAAHDKANSETHKGMKTPVMLHRMSCCCKTSSLVFALTTGDCQQEGEVRIFQPKRWHSFDLGKSDSCSWTSVSKPGTSV